MGVNQIGMEVYVKMETTGETKVEVGAPVKEGAAEVPAETKVVKPKMIKPKALLDKVYEELVKGIKELGLKEKKFPSRTTYSNGNRVVALERGKRQITLHLPKKLKEANTGLKKTYDKRGFGYVRVNNLQQVQEALSLIKWAQSNNK